jgi:hypothetical protein
MVERRQTPLLPARRRRGRREYTLENQTHKVLFRSGTPPIPGGYTVGDPAYNPVGRQLAAGVAGSIKLFSASADTVEISSGCESAWSPDYAFVYHVIDGGGNVGNSFRKYDPATGQSTLWLDVPGSWSHEYFPKLSWDGAYLVFGASSSGHEHDSADYEIFLWKVGSPDTEVTRLTFHSGNDNWPDLWLDKR